MRFDVVTLFPDLVHSVLTYGVTGRAHDAGLVDMAVWNPRAYTHDRHQSVDDRPYGGGPGMVMKVQPVRDAIHAAKAAHPTPAPVIYLSPQGRTLDQVGVEYLARYERLILLCGRYEGIDERLVALEVDEEWSIGDYVLSGGELPAMVMVDALTRLIPGALGHAQSAACDSFAEGLLDCPHYTRPEHYEGLPVPDVLLGGDHGAVEQWRRKQALGRTWLRRPELLECRQLDESDRRLLDEFIREHRSEPEA